MADQQPTKNLITALTADAELVDEGRISLDLVRAGTHLARFGVSAAQDWVARMVEFAALLGIGRIDFDLQTKHAVVEIPDACLSDTELGRLDSVRTHFGADLRTRALQQLAFALAGLARLDVEQLSIRVRTHCGGGVRLDRRAGVEAIEADTSLAFVGLELRVKFERRSRARVVDERSVLARRCALSRMHVWVNGEDVAGGPESVFAEPDDESGALMVSVELDGAVVGLAGFCLERSGARLLVHVNEVLTEDIPFEGEPGFRAVVSLPLDRDLSQAKVLRGPKFAALVDAVAEVHAQALPEFQARRGSQRKALARRQDRALTERAKLKDQVLGGLLAIPLVIIAAVPLLGPILPPAVLFGLGAALIPFFVLYWLIRS